MKKILIIEDEEVLLSTLVDNFTREGLEVITANDGKEGFEVALKEHPDLILLDILMPIMDGMTMLKMLRGDSWGKDAKVIILTNLGDNESVANAVAQGTYDYLIKSNWKIEDVLKRVREKLAE